MAFKNEQFEKVIYFAFGGSGTGASAADPKNLADGTLMTFEAGSVVSEVGVVVTTSITGTTQLDVGDSGDQNGYVAAATLTAGAASQGQGAYLNSTGTNLAKYYSAATALALDATGTATAGAGFVWVRGFLG